MNTPLKLSALAVVTLVAASPAISATTIYSTNFTSFAQPTNFVTDFNIIYGGIDPGANFVKTSSGVWGITTNGNAFATGIVRPQSQTPSNNVKMTGLFLDPSLFASTGAGSYTLSFDLTGSPTGNLAYRAYVFAGSGYDISEATDKRLNLSLSANGFAGYTGLTATGTGVSASQLTMQDISTQAQFNGTQSISFTFTYDGTSAIAVAIGGYNNASTFDNFSVTTNLSAVPEPSTFAAVAGVAALGLVASRRRRQTNRQA